MDIADVASRTEEIHVAHMQGRRARSEDRPPNECPHEEDHMALAWRSGYDERDDELAGHP